MMESFVQFILESCSKLFQLLDLCLFKSFHICLSALRKLLLVFVPISLELFDMLLFLPEEFTHFNIICVQEGRAPLIVLLVFELFDLGLSFFSLYSWER